MTQETMLIYCNYLHILDRSVRSITGAQVFSLPCDRLFGTKAQIPTYIHVTLLNRSKGKADESARAGRRQEASMNHSIYSADRATHLKIVVVALVAGIAVAGFGISARLNKDDGYAQAARVIKAGKPVTVTSSETSMVR
jgi:hypothetical protein